MNRIEARGSAGEPRRVEHQRRLRQSGQIVRVLLCRNEREMARGIEALPVENGCDARLKASHQWWIPREESDTCACFFDDFRQRIVEGWNQLDEVLKAQQQRAFVGNLVVPRDVAESGRPQRLRTEARQQMQPLAIMRPRIRRLEGVATEKII